MSIDPVLRAQLRLLATPLLVLAAFTLPVVALPFTALMLIGAILRQPNGVTQLRRLVPVVVVQLVIVGTVYGVRHGVARLSPVTLGRADDGQPAPSSSPNAVARSSTRQRIDSGMESSGG